MEMKRLTLAARHHNAHKAQENPHGLLIALVCIICALFLSAFSASANVQQINGHPCAYFCWRKE